MTFLMMIAALLWVLWHDHWPTLVLILSIIGLWRLFRLATKHSPHARDTAADRGLSSEDIGWTEDARQFADAEIACTTQRLTQVGVLGDYVVAPIKNGRVLGEEHLGDPGIDLLIDALRHLPPAKDESPADYVSWIETMDEFTHPTHGPTRFKKTHKVARGLRIGKRGIFHLLHDRFHPRNSVELPGSIGPERQIDSRLRGPAVIDLVKNV